MKRRLRIFAMVATGAVVAAALMAVAATIGWRWLFVSQETELTGITFQLSKTAFFDSTGMRGEGERVWIYRIPDDAAQRLSAKDYPLSEYPMWSGLAFDGYSRIRWTPSNRALSDDIQLVLEAALRTDSSAEVTDSSTAVLLNDIDSMGDARAFARDLARLDGTLVSGWYTTFGHRAGGPITNYFVYIMNLEERVLVKLSLLT